MGDAKRRRERMRKQAWPRDAAFQGQIELHTLPAVPELNGARLRQLTGDPTIPDADHVILRAFEARVGRRCFHVGFCLGNDRGVSAVGVAVTERLSMAAPGRTLHVAPIAHADVAWDLVLRNLRTFTGRVLLFTFPDSDVYDAGVAEISYSPIIEQFGPGGERIGRLTAADRLRFRALKASMLGRPAPALYPTSWVDQVEAPWIFQVRTPAGKELRTAIWDGRRNYAHELPSEIVRWVGGNRIAIVQVDRPVGVDRRSSLDLTHKFSTEFDGVIHWARDSETFQSILKSFVRLDLESISPPDLPSNWEPEITIFPVGEGAEDNLVEEEQP